MKNWKLWALFIGIALVVFMCGGYDEDVTSSDSSYESQEQSYDRNDSESAPSWIQGTWYCVTPYGNMQVEITGDHIREIPGDGSSYYGTYHIDGDYIVPETNSHMHYQMDKSSQRLAAGQGYYFEKQ